MLATDNKTPTQPHRDMTLQQQPSNTTVSSNKTSLLTAIVNNKNNRKISNKQQKKKTDRGEIVLEPTVAHCSTPQHIPTTAYPNCKSACQDKKNARQSLGIASKPYRAMQTTTGLIAMYCDTHSMQDGD
jgi:hypothetical protein